MTRPMNRATSRLLCACAMGPLLAGCGDRSGPAAEDVVQWSVDTLALIQPEGIPGEEPFGRIADIEIGDDGSVFVLDGLNRTVRVFDQDGTEVRTFGRRGQGPGELERPAKLLWGPYGNLWVLDLGNGRLTVFDPDGGLVATYVPSGLPIVFPFALTFVAADTLRWVGVTSPDPARPRAAWVESHVADGEIDPTDQMDLPFVEWPLLFQHRDEDITLVLPVPLSGEPLFGFDPAGRLWYTHTADTLLHRWTATGQTDLTIGRDLPSGPVTAVDREEALASTGMEELRSRLGQAGIAEMTSLIPDRKPYLAGFFFDDEENVWVIHAARDASDGTDRNVDVYDADGAFVATLRAPLSADPRPRMRDELLATVVRDALGVESLALYRVRPGG